LESFRGNYIKGILAVTIVSLIGVWYWYGAFISHPEKLSQNNGDSKKNYYTVEYHVLYDTSGLHFIGMNYPYGEHVLFTDNQPVFANLLRFVHRHIFSLRGLIVPIINLSMFISIIVCAIVLCIIFCDFGVLWWYAALAAAGISFLSPQVMRITGHYALAYSFYIPLLWLFLLRYFKKPRIFLSICICVLISFASFIHLYYLLIGILLGGSMWLFYYFKYRPKWGFLALNVFIQVILPFLFVKVFINVSDHITDRPANPFGFMKFRAYWESVFLPVDKPLGWFISNHLIKIRLVDYESLVYIGLVSTLVFGYLLFLFFKYLFSGKWRFINPAPDQPLLSISFWASFVVLLFSMGLPFMAHLEWLLDYTGPLRQFRSIGRFAWIFFYIINVYSFTSIYYYYKRTQKRLLGIFFLIWSLWLILYDNRNFGRPEPSNVSADEGPAGKLVFNPSDFQAIFPMPYFHLGSENFGIEPRCGSFQECCDLSLKTGLPMTAIDLDRTSNAQTLKSLPFACEEYRPIKIVNDFPNQKPLLIALSDPCDLKPAEKDWLSKASYLGHDEHNKFYSLSFDSLRHFGENMMAKKKNLVDSCSLSNNANKRYFYQSFDDQKSDMSYANGAKTSKPGKNMILYSRDLGFLKGDTCTLSLWAYIGKYPYSLMQLNVNEYDKAGKLIVHRNNSIGGTISIFDGDWGLVEFKFNIKDRFHRFEIKIENQGNKNVIYADELLLREPRSYISTPKSGFFVCNNRFYPLQ